METTYMESLYTKIARKVNDMTPEEWKEVFIYAEVEEFASQVYFYYYPKGETKPVYSLDIEKKYDINEDYLDKLRNQLLDYFEELQLEFKNNKQQPWTNLTFILDNTGHFKIDYSYEDLSEADDYERHVIWTYENLGIKPLPEMKRATNIFNNYLSQKKKFKP